MANSFRDIDAQLWVDGEEEADAIDSIEPHPILEAVKSMKEHHAHLAQVADGMSSTSKAVAEGMAGVLADVVNIIRESHKGLMDATEAAAEKQANAATAMAGEMKTIRESIAADAKKNAVVLGSITMAVERLSQRLDGMVEVLTAPRHLVTDKDGKPVGVRIGDR